MSTGKKNPTEAPQVEDAAQDNIAETAVPLDEAVSDMLDNELERIVPGPGEPLTLVDGTVVQVLPLKVRELFAAFKVITRGAAMSLPAFSNTLINTSQDQMVESTLALFLFAFPNAGAEFCEFLRVLVAPEPPEGGWANREEKREAELHLDDIFENADPGDAVDVLTTMVYREAGDIQRLGKKVASAVKLFTMVSPKS